MRFTCMTERNIIATSWTASGRAGPRRLVPRVAFQHALPDSTQDGPIRYEDRRSQEMSYGCFNSPCLPTEYPILWLFPARVPEVRRGCRRCRAAAVFHA